MSGSAFVVLAWLCCGARTDELDKEAAEDAENPLLEDRERRVRELAREEKRGKIKRRSLGNIKFIGELMVRKMLRPKVLLTCAESSAAQLPKRI